MIESPPIFTSESMCAPSSLSQASTRIDEYQVLLFWEHGQNKSFRLLWDPVTNLTRSFCFLSFLTLKLFLERGGGRQGCCLQRLLPWYSTEVVATSCTLKRVSPISSFTLLSLFTISEKRIHCGVTVTTQVLINKTKHQHNVPSDISTAFAPAVPAMFVVPLLWKLQQRDQLGGNENWIKYMKNTPFGSGMKSINPSVEHKERRCGGALLYASSSSIGWHHVFHDIFHFHPSYF